MEDLTTICTFISAIATTGATIIAAVELNRSRKSQEKTEDNNRKTATIEAFNILQNDVLDKLVFCKNHDVTNAVENKDNREFKQLYDNYRIQIARCEHFAVGVNNNIFDFDTVDKLGGVHLYYLYKKVEPVIESARENQSNSSTPYYSQFEELKNRILAHHPELEDKN